MPVFEQTDASGLIYMQARFYAPMYGRFLSPDPARDQHFEQTQSWNIYSYVQNDPTMNFDPSGEAVTPVKVKTQNGVKVSYLDNRMLTKVRDLQTRAINAGASYTYNSNGIFRTKQDQDNTKTSYTKNTNNTSPHMAGLAVDINVSSSLKGASLSELTKMASDAGLSPLSNQKDDPPHLQDNEHITRDSSGKVDQTYKDLISENQTDVGAWEFLRAIAPQIFNTQVVDLTAVSNDNSSNQKKQDTKDNEKKPEPPPKKQLEH